MFSYIIIVRKISLTIYTYVLKERLVSHLIDERGPCSLEKKIN